MLSLSFSTTVTSREMAAKANLVKYKANYFWLQSHTYKRGSEWLEVWIAWFAHQKPCGVHTANKVRKHDKKSATIVRLKCREETRSSPHVKTSLGILDGDRTVLNSQLEYRRK